MRLLAYLDAGSGSVLLQALLGGAAALAVTGRLWWSRVLSLLRIRRPDAESPAEAEPSVDEPGQRQAS